MHLTPAEYVVRVFKGVRKTARAIGRNPSSISKWSTPKERRGCGGGIPRSVWDIILARATEQGLDITVADLYYGRDIPEQAP